MTRNSEMRFCLLISRLAAGVENQISLDDVASAKAIVKVYCGAGCWPAAACVRHNDTGDGRGWDVRMLNIMLFSIVVVAVSAWNHADDCFSKKPSSWM